MAEHLLLVEQESDWKPGFPRLPVVTAREYLGSGELAAKRDLRVINLCRSYRYLSVGYYCSLLGEARGHKVIPTVRTIQDLSSRDTEELNALPRVGAGAGRARLTATISPCSMTPPRCFPPPTGGPWPISCAPARC